jgi:chromate reductase
MEKIVVFSCTNRPDSFTKKVTRLYADILKNKNIEYETFSFEELPKDLMFTETFGNRSAAFDAMIEKYIRSNHRFLFVVPEYNGSFPGILKVFLDSVHPREWVDKKVCLVGVSSGRAGNLRGMEHLTGILNYLKMNVYHNKLPISLIDKILDENAQFMHADQQLICQKQIEGFAKF